MWKLPVDLTIKNTNEKNIHLIKPKPNSNEIFDTDKEIETGISVDLENTIDKDDIFWIEQIEVSRYIISIYLPDVSFYLKTNSIIDIEARKQLETEYIRHNTNPLLPTLFSKQYLRFSEGIVRRCLKFEFEYCSKVNNTFDIKLTGISKCQAKNIKPLSYQESDLILRKINNNNSIDCMLGVARDVTYQFFRIRTKNNTLTKKNFKSDMIVKELMIMCNNKIGEYFKKHKLFGLYLIQSVIENKMVSYYCPEPFETKNPYVTITNPIRKYSDIINHRILKAFLSNKRKPYTYNDLKNICRHINNKIKKNEAEYIKSDNKTIETTIQKEEQLLPTNTLLKNNTDIKGVSEQIHTNLKNYLNKYLTNQEKIKPSRILVNLQYKYKYLIKDINFKTELNCLSDNVNEYTFKINGNFFNKQLSISSVGNNLDELKEKCSFEMLCLLLRELEINK